VRLIGRCSAAPLLIVCPDGSVPFYNALAADLLGLSLPPRETHIDEARKHYAVVRPDDRAVVAPADRPLARSVAEREPIAATYLVVRDGVQVLCKFTSLPFFDETSDFVGAALYIEPLGQPSSA
jgi:hypothetical protein